MTEFSKKSLSRRKFLRTGGAAGAAVGALAMPSVVRAQTPVVIKMQSSWSATQIFQEMAQQYVDIVQRSSGDRIKIDLLPAGAVVGAFQVQDALNDGAIDAMHTVPVYWYGKHKGASLFGTGPVFGGTAADMLGWFYQGGGKDFYRELVQDILGLNIVGFYGMPMPAQPLGWFKNEISDAEQLKALKYRTVGLAADLFQSMGVSVTQLPGGEIVPAMDRGVIDAFEFNNPTSDKRFGAQDVAKNYMLGSYHQASEAFEIAFNKDIFDSLAPDLQAILENSVLAASTANLCLAMRQYSADLLELQAGGVNVKRTPVSILEAQLAAWDTLIPTLEEDAYIKKVLDSQRAWVQQVGYYQLMNAPSYQTAYEHYFPGKIPA
jgi:TRAP-type mannitol/chloroaromatic compound transport system substrate-binding protein